MSTASQITIVGCGLMGPGIAASTALGVEAAARYVRQLVDGGLVGEEVVLTSTTSGLPISDITRGLKRPGRTATTPFWFPGHLMPLDEIVMGGATDESVALRLKDLLRAWGKALAIVRRDFPGSLPTGLFKP